MFQRDNEETFLQLLRAILIGLKRIHCDNRTSWAKVLVGRVTQEEYEIRNGPTACESNRTDDHVADARGILFVDLFPNGRVYGVARI